MSEEPAGSYDGVTASELANRWGCPEVHLFASLGSTNDVARRLAAAGSPAGTLVLADEQVAGRGRAGRTWASPPGFGLWFSLVAPPAGERAAALPLLVGLSVASALDAFLPASGVAIKWPNDLYVGERKLGGILCESTWEGARAGPVVVGVGLNLRQNADTFPAELRGRATSVKIESGAEVSRLVVAARLIPAVRITLSGALRLDPDRLDALERRDVLRGHPVEVSDPMTGRRIAVGQAQGINSQGSLLVREASGAQRRVHSGTVRRLD